MTQAMHTSGSGIAAAQIAINVVSNNIANMNTTAFKESNVTFSDLFYNTISVGTPSGAYSGGINPKQIGYGAQAAAISKNFTDGTFNSTGLTNDITIEGNGFLTIMDANGALYYTRDGHLDFDSSGYLVTSNGYKVVGSNLLFDTTNTQIPVKIPPRINATVEANANTGTNKLEDLNNLEVKKGTFNLTLRDVNGATIGTPISCNIQNEETLAAIASMINQSIKDQSTFNQDDANPEVNAYIEDGMLKLNIADTTTIKSLEVTNGTSDFATATELAISEKDASDTYNSKILDYQVTVNPETSVSSDLIASDYVYYENGTIEVSYSNGDKLTVLQDDQSNMLNWRYIVANGVVIDGKDCSVSENVAIPANFQLILANFINPGGLTQTGDNLYTIGINSGSVIYGVPNANGFGSIASGGLESSNVDLTKQFSNMIIAQRAIEANSRVFNTANDVMKNLVYLGQ